MWDLVGNPEDRFSQNEAHMIIKDWTSLLRSMREVNQIVTVISKISNE